MTPDELRNVVNSLVARAKAHGVELLSGESNIATVQKLLDRLDKYRDKPEHKGRILIE